MRQGARVKRNISNTVGLDRLDVLKGVWKGGSDDKRFVQKHTPTKPFGDGCATEAWVLTPDHIPKHVRLLN